MSEASKPLGIVLIALYSGIAGLLAVPAGCTSMVASGLPGIGATYSILSFLFMGYGVALLAATYGLWTIQPWGRDFAWWLYVAAIPLGVLFIFPVFPGQMMSLGNTILQLIGIALDVWIISYLGQPGVESLFEPNGRQGSFDEYVRKDPR